MLKNLSQRHLALLAMTVCAIIWGASLIVAQSALASIESLTFIWIRFLFVAVFSLPLAVYTLVKRVFTKRQLFIFALIEFTNIMAMWFLFRGLGATNALYSAFFVELRPLFVTLGGIFILKEKEDAHEWLGLFIAAIGSLVIVISPLLFISKLSALALLPGILLLLFSNTFNMVDMLSIKKYYHNLPKLPLLSILALIDFSVSSVLLAITRPSVSLPQLVQPSVLLPTLYMAIIVSVIATGLLFFSLDRLEASEAEVFNYLKPFIYIPLAMVVLGVQPTLVQIIGLGFIISGFIIANKKPAHHQSKNGRKILKHPHHRI
jgi:drug/metabolite transporter (DMT)-like permease